MKRISNLLQTDCFTRRVSTYTEFVTSINAKPTFYVSQKKNNHFSQVAHCCGNG